LISVTLYLTPRFPGRPKPCDGRRPLKRLGIGEITGCKRPHPLKRDCEPARPERIYKPRRDLDNGTAFITDVTFEGAGTFTGTMTPITVSVPEPSTWALMVIGFAGLGWIGRRRASVIAMG
jgi:hypothetical protein